MPYPNHECGDCGVCCWCYAIREPDLQKPAGERCKHLTPDNKCAIYDKRPPTCSGYLCTWMRGELPDECRPDRYGFVMSRDSGKTCLRVTPLVMPDEHKAETIRRHAFRDGYLVVRFVMADGSLMDFWRDKVHYVVQGHKVFAENERLVEIAKQRLAGMKQETCGGIEGQPAATGGDVPGDVRGATPAG